MPKRISRKLLVGLGSIVTFGAVGTVSGFGIKSIIDSTINHNQANQLAQTFPEADYTEMSNYNVASKDMFIDTTDLSRFHFGNVQKGQTVTPYGWIGIYRTEKTNTFQNIALIGWNGEVLWTYDNTQGRDVYDVKYDYNTDLLFVLKTSSPSGISQNGSTPIELDVLEGKTGRRVDRVTEAEFKTMQSDAYSTLSTVWNLNPTDKVKNLMQIDLISKRNKTNEVLLNWMPNYMQIGDRSDGSLTTLFNFRTTWHNLMKLIKFTKKTDQSGNWTHNIIKPNSSLLFSNFNFAGGNNWQEPAWDLEARFLNNYTFITNPFFTINNDDSYTLHMIVASNGTRQFPQNKDQQENGAAIIHKAIGITNDFQNPKTNINVFQQMGGKFTFKKSQFYNEYNNWPYKLALNNKTNWYKFNTVTPDAVIKANTRINRNMFDNNSIITPYIYSIKSKYPIYDVMQLNIDPATGKIFFDTNVNNKKMTKRWSFGQDIVNYYDANKKSYGSEGQENSKVNRIFPYPDADGKNLNVDHNYNRLISVSPFDNTFIYAAKPYLKYAQFNPDNNANNDKYAGFWISSDEVNNNKKPLARPFIIVNDSSALRGTVDPKMTSISALYNDGFTFDPTSFYTDANGRKHLNLYYNQNGSDKNTTYTKTNIKTSKIGLLSDLFSVATQNDNNSASRDLIWTASIANPYTASYNGTTTLNLHTTGITRSDFSTLIHSRADLTKWYNRTWKNLNFAGNLFSANERINDNDSSSSRAIAKTFSKLTDPEFESGQSVDLVSAWKDKSDNGTLYATDPVNYNRLAIKRPVIKVGTVSSGPNSLPVITRYEMSTEANKIINEKPTWGLRASLQINDYNKSIMVLQKVQTITNVSTQIVSSWEKQYKMEKIQRVTDQLNSQTTAWSQLSNPSWQDKITNPNLAFGNANNNVAKNGQAPLRLMLKLVKPTGSLPTWFSNDFDDYFAKAYPIQPINDTETSFAEMVKEYANKKAQLIDLSDPNNAPVGLGNLKIDAYLELNPAYTGSQKIYYGEGKNKKYLQDSSGTVFIYQDQFLGSRTIYDQSQIEYDKFQEGGFGKDGSALRATIQKSWKDNIFNGNNIFNIKVSTNYNQLPDTLVRKSAGDNSPLFSFDYRNGTNNVLEITPNAANLDWFKNHFENFNRLLNLFVQFEYKATGQANWSSLDNLLTDKTIKQNFQQNGNKLVFSNVNPNIEKIRFRLKQFTNPDDKNLAIDIQGFNENDAKYISAEHSIAFEKYIIKQGQIRSVYFANKNSTTGKTLASITKADIDDFINAVVDKSTSLNSAKQKVTLKFNYNNKTGLDSQKLYDEIRNKLNLAEPFAISNGNDLTNGETIEAFFTLKNTNDSVKFFDESGNNASQNLLKDNVVSNLISEIDLNDYISQLMNKPLAVTPPPTTPGSFNPNGSTIQFPTNNATSGFFAGMSFNDIKTKLRSKLGIVLRFKEYNAQTNSYGNWVEDITSIRFYDPTNPQIKIGFKQLPDWNTKLVKGNQSIEEATEFALNLALLKLVKLPQQNEITNMISQFNAKNVFSGNTKNLVIANNFNEAKEIVVNALKAASGNNGYDGLNSKTELVFKLGDFKNNDKPDGYFSGEELKQALAKHSSDIDSNGLKMKVKLKDEDLFTLASDLKNYEFVLLNDNNTNIKKFLNGTTWENALRNNGITLNPGSSKQNLSYAFKSELNEFQANGEVSAKEVTLEYQLISTTNNNPNWVQGNLPKSVSSDVNQIKVRIANKNSVAEANKVYTYGPQQQSNWAVLTIDLQNIPTVLAIDPIWFEQTPISSAVLNDLNLLTTSVIQTWEQKIWQKVNNNQGLPAELRDKVYIKYTLEIGNGGHRDLEAATLQTALLNEQKKYDSAEHHGIFRLWNKTDNTGYKIKATFAKRAGNEQKIQFQKNGQNVDNDEAARTSFIDTDNVKSTLDLTAWISNLISTPTTINTTNAGQIPAGGLVPPQLNEPSNSKLFAGQTFANIETWLKAAKVNFWWRKEASGNSWVQGTAAITQYDPTKQKLWFAIDNQASNLILKLGNSKPTLDKGQDNKIDPIEIKLDAPAIINVGPNQLQNLGQYFSGNTKYLTVQTDKITQELDKIKKNLGPGFEQAPLTIMIQVGNQQFYDYKQVAEELKKLPDDVENGIVVAKFAIDENASNKDKFQIITGGDNNQQIIDDQGKIKVYINDKQIYNDLQATSPSGTSKDLRLEWKNGISINEQNGVLSAAGRGKGLKIEYTFKTTLQGDESDPTSTSAADINEKWVPVQPKAFRAGVDNNLFIRIRLTDANKYTYENINKRISIDLTKLKSIILLDPAWLKQEVAPNEIQLSNFGSQQISEYEKKVLNATQIAQPLKEKIEIKYDFNNQTDLTKDNLIQSIQNYKTNNSSKQSLGILQLANGTETTTNGALSEAIIAKFSIKDQFSSSYEMEIKPGITNTHQLDTSKVITTIDFSKVLTWLQSLKVPFENQTVNIPTVTINNEEYFNNQPWTKVEQTLKGFGIIIEYRKMMNATQGNEDGWSESISSVDDYNPSIGKFQIRFKTDGAKSKNIRFKTTSSETVDGTNVNNKSKAYDINLKVKLMVQISQQYTDTFKNTQNVVSGNTKYLNILADAETQMINSIKLANQTNNPAFDTLDLKVEYQIGNGQNGEWKTRADFIQYLQNQQTNQTTNEISFRFAITDNQKDQFGVNQTVYTLSEQKSATAADIKIKYYINNSDWETKAGQIKITGTSDRLNWNLSTIFNGVLNETTDGKVYLRTNSASQAIQIFFTTNPGATYDNPPQTSDNENEIGSKWVSKKPTAISAATTNLKIKLVAANSGFVYGPAYKENNVTPIAQAHDVAISIQKVLYVNKEWFQPELVSTEIDISTFEKTHLDKWEAEVYKKIKDKNQVQDEIARKINIKYFFEDEPAAKLDASGLINKIIQLRTDYNNTDLGILQLWNGTKGKKLYAIFESAEPNNYTLRVDNNPNDPTEDQIKNQLNTSKIFTTISLVKYIETLKTIKTSVELDTAAGKGKIKSFTPPSGQNSGQIFDGKEYSVIAQRLQDVGVKIEFSKDKTTWLPKENLKEYDIQKNALFLKFTVQSSNIKLQLDGKTQIENNQDSGNFEIKLPLQVPKYILIENSKPYWNLTTQFNFSGTTKVINFDQTKITEFVEVIKTDNVNAGGDQDYKNAPLEIQFQVGTGSDFVEISKLKNYLQNQPDDLPDREIKFKFALKDGTDPNQWRIQNEGEYPLLGDQDPKNNVKLYINDKGVFDQLQAMIITGTNDALKWNWPNLVGPVINENTGVLDPSAHGSNFGKGLKFEFTFNKNHQNASVGTNHETQWVPAVPKKYDANKGFTDVYLRIKLTKNDYYTYDYADRTITLSLSQVGQNIILQTSWLEEQFNNEQELNLDDLTVDKIEQYEQVVKQRAKNGGIDQSLLSKFTIKYQFDFNGNLDDTKLITKDQLIQKINDYKNNKNQSSFGILQLWNQTAGVKIAAKFVDADEKDKYYISVDNPPEHKVIDTSNIITTIDFSKVINWLITTRKLVDVTETATAITFTIPTVSIKDDPIFNTKDWTSVESALKLFGINPQYREILDANNPTEDQWKNNLNEIKKYDQNIGQIGIRFKFDKLKAKNIKFKTGTNPNDIYDGKTTDATPEFKLNLNIKLTLKINQNFLTEFINGKDVIKGNTKYLTINATQEQAMIKKIKDENAQVNSEFSKADLIVKYKLETQAENKWNTLNEFVNDLQSTNADQQSNQVMFKFEVNNKDDFAVENSAKTLFDPTSEANHDNWKVKIFINNGTWEDNASKVAVTGINSALKWEWKQLQVKDETNNKVGNDKLQVEFSAKTSPNYGDTDVEDNGDLNTKWTRTKPTQLDPTIQNLWIRLKAKSGYVYGPAYTDNGQSKTANVHKVDLKIKREIIVDPKALSTSLSLPQGKQYVTDITKADLEKFVNDGLGKIQHPELQTHVTVRFNFNNKTGLNSQQLYDEIQSIINRNNAPNYGVLQLWNTTAGKKIHAYYDLVVPNGEYILVSTTNGDAKEPQEVVTGHIRTKIDLVAIVNDLKNQKIKVETIRSKNNRALVTIKKWIMPETKSGNDALNGLSWNVFENTLKGVGVSIKARIVKNPDIPNQGDWKSLDQLKEYDDTTLKLALRFELDSRMADNIVLSVLGEADVDPDQQVNFSKEFKMNIKAPATVVVDQTFITNFIAKETFTGDTKFININSQPEEELIDNIVNKNLGANADVFKDLKNRLEVQYYLGKNSSNNEADWRTAEQFQAFLKTQSKDQETNKIWFRLNVKDPDQADGQVFQIDKNPQVLVQEQIDAQAKIKIYINETGFTDAIGKLRAVGSTDDFSINGIEAWQKTIPTGLEVGYSNETNPEENDDSKWFPTVPKTLNTDKKLWVRFKVQDGYKFQGAKQNDEKYGPKQAINTDGIRVIIKLEKSWLEKIQITGNTKEANINEEDVLKAIEAAGVLPTGENDLVELQYSIKGTNDWVTKEEFTKKLLGLSGSKDSQNFILRREELLVRFNIKNKNNGNDYGLNIDGQNIDKNNRDDFNVQMVEEGKRNDPFEGYINVDLLKDFVKDNFRIVGSTSQPRLIINNRDQMDTMFAPYASETLFDIQFSTTKNNDGSWDWTNTTRSILKNGKLIDERGLIDQGVTIGADKHFAIRFISKNLKYKVYKGGAEQTNGHILDLTDNVKITIEIENPFTAQNKTLALWTREESGGKNTAKYYQGQGGFKIAVANKNTFDVEDNGKQSAQEFLQASNLTDGEKNALEFVFHNFGSSPSEQEIEQVKKAINNYGDKNTWKSFDSIKEENSYWSTDQGLKVGDYVAVAIRVKENFATQENPFILKDDDYSMILPVVNVNGAIKKPARISGYKVNTSSIAIEQNSVAVSSMINLELPPLDGWSELQRVSLKSDALDNYLGVDLKVQLYSEFHEKNGHVLLSSNNKKLVKRETNTDNPNVEDKGPYKNHANQDIVDQEGTTVKIYKDKTTNRLSKPKKSNQVTNSKMMTNLGGGKFRLEAETDNYQRAKFSLFRNQDVDLLLVANPGEGSATLPDFYLDQEDKTISLTKEISEQIKFPVENEKKISYAWNYDDFLPGQIEYKSPNNSSQKPENGNAQIATIFKLIKKEGNSDPVTITGNSIEEAMEKIQKQLDDDFSKQLKFQISYFNNKGSRLDTDGNDIYQFKDLRNKDRIVLKIVAVEDDLFYVSQEAPLVINVNGLTEAAPDQATLQHLRVKQGGLIDGQGSFKVLVSNPDNPNEDDKTVLKGWKFLIRVWHKNKDEDGNWKIKIDWSDDPARIKGLSNGDKVEWKLVSADGNPVKDAYYNTIALNHQQKPDGTMDFKFGKVNYPNGQNSYTVVEDGIGAYPEVDQYPEKSGFVISGLKDKFEIFKIDKSAFEKVLAQLQPTYVGINTQGTIRFDSKYFEQEYWVNTKGDIYTQAEKPQLFKDNPDQEIIEIKLIDFLKQVTFYTHDPVIANYQGGFKFSGNDININNHLTNGDQMWATFDTRSINDVNNNINNNDPLSSLTTRLNDVSGLKDIIDPMSPLWYVLMALAGIATLGTAALIAFLIARHKKLKGKN